MDDRIVDTTKLAKRWGSHPATVTDMWRTGRMPKPFNSHLKRGWRWNLDVIEAFERGEWQPPTVAELMRLVAS